MILQAAGKVAWATAGIVSSVGLLAVEDIPGWSDFGTLGKGSILISLILIVAGVVVKLFHELDRQRKDYLAQLDHRTTAFEGIVERITNKQESASVACSEMRAQDRAEREQDRRDVMQRASTAREVIHSAEIAASSVVAHDAQDAAQKLSTT